MNSILFGTLLILLTTVSSPARGDFKPLTRAEPIVRMVLQESSSEPFNGMVAVAGVALDRVRDSRWPSTEHGVIYQYRQFSGMSTLLRRYSRADITLARKAVETARSGVRPCGTVLWYHTTEISPVWNRHLDEKCKIGLHVFFGDET